MYLDWILGPQRPSLAELYTAEEGHCSETPSSIDLPSVLLLTQPCLCVCFCFCFVCMSTYFALIFGVTFIVAIG